jgi:hypothetical protein
MKKQGAILGAVGLFVMTACGTPGPRQATSAEDIVGTWRHTTTDFGHYFMEDGTFHAALSASAVEERPAVVGEYWFEDSQLFMEEVEATGLPPCGGRPAIYEVLVLESGNLEFTAIQDDCPPRRDATEGEHEPVQ